MKDLRTGNRREREEKPFPEKTRTTDGHLGKSHKKFAKGDR